MLTLIIESVRILKKNPNFYRSPFEPILKQLSLEGLCVNGPKTLKGTTQIPDLAAV